MPIEIPEELFFNPHHHEVKKKGEIAPEEVKLSDIYSYKPLSRYIGLIGKIPCRADSTYVGVEIELEGILDVQVPKSTWIRTEDNSLKENGAEFVTIPIQFKFLEVELERLFNGIGVCNISSRCSVHVHLNCRDLTCNTLYSFILLYLIFEKSLYNFSGGRWNNNFCIPLNFYPQIAGEFVRGLDKNIIYDVWYKYLGFNLSPIWGGESKKFGTIEFRHMSGTTDTARIISWINLIVSLKISAKRLSPKVLIEKLRSMNTTSSYYWLVKEVFKEFSPLLTNQPTFKQDVENCVTVAKLVFLGGDNNKTLEKIPLITERR